MSDEQQQENRINYTDFEGGFDQLVLEESFVLNLKTTMSFAEFKMDFAVNDKYPYYTAPPEDSEYDYTYRKGRIFFPNVEQIKWSSRIQPYIDPASGSVDYGAIDYFYKLGDWYFLAGFWGEMEVQCGPPILEIEEVLEKQRAEQQQQQQQQKAQAPQG